MQTPSSNSINSMLFDLDGTLVDTAEDFAKVLDLMTSIAGLPPVPQAAVHQTVSSGARALVELAFGIDSTAHDFKALHSTLLSLYGQQVAQTRARLYPTMDKLLTLLEERGIKW
ncbi:MAG: HAD hydrolase-like protein, partial [Gammaproteobacteria bacterium]|nr:HAD hydrolase-like protein [Gammaproteobacteria bacterium]